MDVLTILLGVAFLLFLFWGLGVVARHYRLADNPVRFPRMVEHLGLSLRGIGNTEIAVHLPTASRLCFNCRSKRECDEWIAAEDKRVDPPDFCLNRGYLRLARRMADTTY